MPEEVHISSLVVHAMPRRVERVAQAIARIPGVRVHGSSPAGKLVITLDTDSAEAMRDRMTEVQRTDGVLAAALVYQYADSADAMNEEVPDAR